MPRVHISTTFEPTRVDYRELVGMGCAFGTVSHACATKCEKCEVDKAYVLHSKSFEDVSVVSNCTEREDMVVSQEDHMLYLLRKALLLSLVLIVLEADFTALWLHLRCLLFRFRARLLAIPRSDHNFCHFVVATMRLLALLQR